MLHIEALLGRDAEHVLNFSNPKIDRAMLTLPSPNHSERVFGQSDRSVDVVQSLERLYDQGRLGGTGYLSILPVDQSIEHSAGEAFVQNPEYFDPIRIVELAFEAGCSAVTSTVGVLAMASKRYAERIPFIVKINHNDLMRYPNDFDQTMFASVEQAYNLGACGVGATIYFGSPESKRQLQEVSAAFYEAHKKGMFTVAWCYVRNAAFQKKGKNYELSADLTGQAVHLAATIGADIVKQKIPTCNGGYRALSSPKKSFGKYDPLMYTKLLTEHPIDMVRYQVLHAYAGRVGLISSGGPSGKHDVRDAVYAAVINKRAGGHGLIIGRKAFQKPMREGIALLHAVQDVYRDMRITIA